MDGPALQLNMLVVDDDDIDRERVRRFLARSTLQVTLTEAASGAEALSLVRQRPFDCVMLDNHLGDADGASLLVRIREEACHDCPVIFITGAGNESLAVHVMQDGASDYLSKTDLSPEILVRAVRRSIETHRLHAENARLHRELEQRVETQAATLRQRERDLRALVDSAPTLMGNWDENRRCRFGNLRHRDWLGADMALLPGTPLDALLGPALSATFEPAIRQALAGHAASFEARLPGLRGEPDRPVQVQVLPDTDETGRPHGFYLSMSDVGPQKLAQARIQELLTFSDAVIEHSPIGIAVFGPDGHCTRANAAFAAMCGAAPAELQGQDCRERADWRACGLAEAAAATLADGLPRRAEYALLLPRGEPADWDCALARVDRAGGAHLLVIARDIGEQRRAHAALVQAHDAAQAAARAKSAFLANMSHEVRTPMNAIIGLSRLALEDPLPAPTRAFLEKVHHASLALMGLLDDILDYSKIEAGHMRIERTGVDLEDVLQRVADLFQARLAQQDLTFEVDLSPALPRHVWGDPLRLSQILNNLVGNAIKFTPSGGVRLVVDRVDAADGDGDGDAPAEMRFAVEDTGIGIADDARQALFDPFVQADGTITRRFGGTGLGLAICKRLVEMMGGRIGVHSAPGRGSRFWFTLPLEPGPPPAAARPANGLSRLSVAVVDEDSSHREMLLRNLAAWGARAHAVRSVGDVPAAVITDGSEVLLWHLADVHDDALRAFERLVAARPRLPVLLVATPAAQARWGSVATHPSVRAIVPGPVLASALLDAMSALAPARAAGPGGGAGVGLAVGNGGAGDPLPTSPPAPDDGSALREAARPLHGRRILLAEDNPLNQIVAAEFLRRAGMEVEVAPDGAAAVEAVRAHPAGHFAAVLMDLHMPVLDGLGATARLRALPQGAALPVIAMTAAALPEERERCLAAGMVDHVSKPVLPEQLVQVLLARVAPAASPDSDPLARRVEAPVTRPATLPGAAAVAPAPFDPSRLLRRLGGDAALMRTLVGTFVGRERDVADRLAALLGKADREGALTKSHDLKGSAGAMGATATEAAAQALHAALAAGGDGGAELAALRAALARDLDAMAAVLPGAGT